MTLRREVVVGPSTIWDVLLIVALLIIAGGAFLIQSCDKDARAPASRPV